MDERLQEILAYYGARADSDRQETVVELLREVQRLYGYIPAAQKARLADVCGVKEALITGLIRRYPSLRESDYRHVITACSGERCRRKNGAAVLAALRRELGVEAAEGLSRDGAVFLKVQNCLKHCATSPNLLVDGELHPHMTPEQAAALARQLCGQK